MNILIELGIPRDIVTHIIKPYASHSNNVQLRKEIVQCAAQHPFNKWYSFYDRQITDDDDKWGDMHPLCFYVPFTVRQDRKFCSKILKGYRSKQFSKRYKHFKLNNTRCKPKLMQFL